MKLEIWRYTCVNGCKFSAPALGEGAYGEFLLWPRNGEMACLNIFQGARFETLDISLQNHSRTSMLTPLARAKLLQNLFGPVSCDCDTGGSPFHIDMMCPCSTCGVLKMSAWELKRPAEVVDIDVKHVMHTRWNSLSDLERSRQIDAALALA